jgi:hypothetical protein
LPQYWDDPIRLLVVGLLLFMLFVLIRIAAKVFASILSRRTAAANETGPDGKPSPGRRRRPSLRELGPLHKSLAFARQPDGGAIVFPYMFLWRGYRLTPEQARSYLGSWGESAVDARRIHRATWIFEQVTGWAACGCFLWLIFRHDRWSFLSFAIALAAMVGLMLLRRSQTKRSFETQFPTATERRPDPNRVRKRVLLLMLSPMWGHLGTGLFAPLLLWVMATTVIGIATKLSNGTFDVGADLRQTAIAVPIAALTALMTYIAYRHIAFRIRHGRGVSVDDFHAL